MSQAYVTESAADDLSSLEEQNASGVWQNWKDPISILCA